MGVPPSELSISRDDGTDRTVSVAVTPVVSRSGEQLGQVYALQDVTDVVTRKQMESFKQMAAIAAHEMKNSVTGLNLVTEHLVARLDSGALDADEARRMAGIILDSVARLDHLPVVS